MNLPKYRSHKIVEATKIIDATRRKDGSMELVTEAGEFRTSPGYFERCYSDTELSDFGYFLRDEDGYETWVSTERFERDYSTLQELEDNRTANALEKVIARDEPAEAEKPIQPKKRGRKKKTATQPAPAEQPTDN